MARPNTSTPRRRLAALLIVTFAFGCSGSGGGCAALAPLPTWFRGPKTDNAVNIRLSPGGINYLNSNWRTLVETFAPGGKLIVPVGCQEQNITGVGTLAIADQGSSGCTSESCGQMDGKCDFKDEPRDVIVNFTGFSLTPRPTDTLEASLTVSISTSNLYIATGSDNASVCAFLSRLKCHANFSSARTSPSSNTIDAKVKFTIDTRWDKLLSFSISSLAGTQVCGASGSSPPPACLEPDDLVLGGDNNCGNVYCSGANIGIVKDFILKQISPTLQKQVQAAIATQACQPCGSGMPYCPDIGGATSTCTNGVCVDDTTHKCTPRFLGVEGRVAPGDLLGGFGVPGDAKLDLSVAAGSSVSVDRGFTVGTRGGFASVGTSDCVPLLTAPVPSAVPAPDFDAEATAGSPYHVGIGISQPFLNLAFFHAHQAGALCFTLSNENVGLINTGLFKTFLPSLGKLASRDGKDAPMMVVLRPAKAPVVEVGQGTYDLVTKRPVKPLLTIMLPEVTVDFYAQFDDRMARLFSLTADITLPLSLVFNGCSSVQPVLGDLKQLVTKIHTANSEMLAEDPKVLTDLIPAVIGFAEPALSAALQPFALPQVGNFQLKVNESKGIGLIAGTEHYNHLGLFAQLLPASAACAVSGPRVLASLKESRIPKASQMRLTGKGLTWPTAVLTVGVSGATGTPEYAYRIDRGMWTTFFAPTNGNELEVSHPAFLMQGMHTIEVRSRLAEEPHGISAPVAVGFRVDWDAPEVHLTADVESTWLKVLAHDTVTPDAALVFSYQVGEGAFSAFGPAREVDLAAIEGQGGVTVRVRDESGNVGEATYRVATTAVRPEGVSGQVGSSPEQVAGCSASGLELSLGALAAGLSFWRRRRRA